MNEFIDIMPQKVAKLTMIVTYAIDLADDVGVDCDVTSTCCRDVAVSQRTDDRRRRRTGDLHPWNSLIF